MTGPEHYREAERLLVLARETELLGPRADARQRAAVHASLAAAAFLAANAYSLDPADYDPGAEP